MEAEPDFFKELEEKLEMLIGPLPQNRPDDWLSEDEDVSDDGGREDDGEEVVLSDEGVHGMTAMSWKLGGGSTERSFTKLFIAEAILSFAFLRVNQQRVFIKTQTDLRCFLWCLNFPK